MKNICKSLLITVLSLVLIITVFPTTVFADEESIEGFTPRLTAPSRSSAYYNRELNVYSQGGYGMPNCTAYVFGRIYEITGEKPLLTRGSAGEWWSINKRNGYYEYGQEAQLGAIACWSNHVAVVEKIEGNTITCSQSHWGGNYFDTCTVTIGANRFGQTFYGFIYASKDYFDELERQQKEAKEKERLASLSYKMETPKYEVLETEVVPQFKSVDITEKSNHSTVIINSLMLKNIIEDPSNKAM